MVSAASSVVSRFVSDQSVRGSVVGVLRDSFTRAPRVRQLQVQLVVAGWLFHLITLFVSLARKARQILEVSVSVSVCVCVSVCSFAVYFCMLENTSAQLHIWSVWAYSSTAHVWTEIQKQNLLYTARSTCEHATQAHADTSLQHTCRGLPPTSSLG